MPFRLEFLSSRGRVKSGKKHQYPRYTTPAGHSAESCWENPQNKKFRPVDWVLCIKKNPSGPPEASTVEIVV